MRFSTIPDGGTTIYTSTIQTTSTLIHMTSITAGMLLFTLLSPVLGLIAIFETREYLIYQMERRN